MKHLIVKVGLLSIAILSQSCRQRENEADMKVAGQSYHDVVYDEDFKKLYQSDFGAINQHSMKSNALPWKVIASAMLLYNQSQTGNTPTAAQMPSIMGKFGFMYPTRIGNLNDQSVISSQIPMGMVRKKIKYGAVLPVDVVNIGCIACHGGAVHDKSGNRTSTAWIGSPNTSINLDGYVDYVFKSLKFVYLNSSSDKIDQALGLMKTQFDASFAEMETMKWIIVNIVKKRIQTLASTSNSSTPFSNGGPGFTNGVAALKFQMGVVDVDKFHPEETAFTSIPDLTHRGMRTSILYDGFYSPYEGAARFTPKTRQSVTKDDLDKVGDIVSFFAIPTMGQSIDGAIAAAPEVRKAVSALHYGYRAPAFPGNIDEAKATRGRALFKDNCSECHGTYDGSLRELDLESYPNRLVAQSEIGTDPSRWQLITDRVLEVLNKDPRIKKPSNPKRSEGYVPPILSGLWSTAPYLHNGSVPTLYHFLHPEKRPKKFYAGGHRLNYDTVGIDGAVDANGIYDYPVGYKSWSDKVLFDTSLPGKHATGHEDQISGLSESDKGDLLEFLKLL